MLGLVGVDMASSSAVVATAPVGGAAQTRAWPDGSRRSFTRSGEAARQQLRCPPLGTSIGFRQRLRQHGGRQVEAMKLLITAATLAGCSSATQCPLSAMTLLVTCRLPASPSPAATSGNAVA